MTDTGNLLPHGDASPEVAPSAWVAPGAHVIGAVHLGERAPGATRSTSEVGDAIAARL